MTGFVKVACIADLPAGTGLSVESNGRRVALFNVDGSIRAVDGTCPHRGGPLGEGLLKGSVVTCPWHFWQFDVVSGQAPGLPDACIERYSVRVEGNDILVEARALAQESEGALNSERQP